MVVRNRFQNKVVLVTGSGQGIGRGIALRFAKEGATLIVVDIKEELANAVLKDIQSTGSNGLVIKADATQAEEVKKAVKTALDKFGKIDVLVNNVGNCVVRPLLESSESDWEGSININAKSTFLWSMAVVKSMIERKSGCIVNISSGAGKVGDPYSGVYTAAKHAVIGLTKNLALELAPYGIRANAVCPGEVDTPMEDIFLQQLGSRIGKSPDQLRKELVQTIPLGRLVTPEDIAGVVAFLASDDSKFMTGQSINVTGGGIMY